jgi:hypothetical protein
MLNCILIINYIVLIKNYMFSILMLRNYSSVLVKYGKAFKCISEVSQLRLFEVFLSNYGRQIQVTP